MTRTMSKNPPVCNNDNLLVSPDIETILPEVLIEYLWKLVLCENWQNYERQIFILETGELSGRKIQNIYHIGDYDNSTDTRRVYGVEPVNCKLQVLNSPDGYQMKLCANA